MESYFYPTLLVQVGMKLGIDDDSLIMLKLVLQAPTF